MDYRSSLSKRSRTRSRYPTKSDPDVEHQLTQVQQEAKANKEKYIKHLNNLHGQLVDAGQARDAAVNQAAEAANDKRKIRKELEATHTSLVKEHASNQQLRSQLTEQNRLLQQTRSQGTPAQMPSTQGAVSYQQRISVLERQLKIQQRENARLQNLSDCNKPYDDSDDSEPEYPRYVVRRSLLKPLC